MSTRHSERRLAQSRDEIVRLLDRHRVLETMAHQQDSPKRDLLEQLQHKQNVAELEKRLRTMHAADIALRARVAAAGRSPRRVVAGRRRAGR